MDFVLGIDIGTQGTKAVLFTASGQLRASAFLPSRLLHPTPDAVEEDPEFQFETVCKGIAECMEKSGASPSSVAALAIDGQMAGVIGVGADGRHITPYDSWLDTRCADEIAVMQEAAGDEVIRKSGGPPSVNHGPKILWWQRERPEVFKRITSFVQPGCYAAMRLCGLKAADAFIDTSYLHFSGFADNQKSRWDEGLCRTFKVDASKLPHIVAPHERIGKITEAAARQCGLAAGTPVIAGCGDTAASFLAAGAVKAGICVDVAGTASVFASTTRAFHPDSRFRTLSWGASATPGLWHPYAYIAGGGLNLEWFRTEVARVLGSGFRVPGLKLGDSEPETRSVPLAVLDALAAELPPDAELPLFVPHMSGRVSPSQPNLRGAWVGLTRDHTLGHLYRSMLEAVALEYGIYLSVLRELDSEFHISELRVTGGGRKSALWNQIKAGVLGAHVVQIAGSEGAPKGAAMLAALGAGLIKSLGDAAATWVETGAVTEPRPAQTKRAAARLSQYKSLLETLNQWSCQ